MECLIRTENGFEWKKIDVKRSGNLVGSSVHFVDDNHIYRQKDILKVKNSIVGKYVHCNDCNTLIKIGQEEKHYRKMENQACCAKCTSISTREESRTEKRTFNEKNGTIQKKMTINYEAYCGYTYGYKSFNEAKDGLSCKYYSHRRKGVGDIPPLTCEKYPHMYDVIPTVNALKGGRWILSGSRNGNIVYKYGKTGFEATFDKFGYLIYLSYETSNNSEKFIYAPKHKKFFRISCSNFVDGGDMSCYIPSSKLEVMNRIVKAIYKEA